MPELPEVETLRRDLERDLVGEEIVAVAVHGRRSIRRYSSPQRFIDALVGRSVTAVGRRGTYLLIELDDVHVLVVHLRMSGQLLKAELHAGPAPKHTHVVITTHEGWALRFVDPRTFGELFVSARNVEGVIPELAHFGIEPLDPATTPEAFATLLRSHRVMLKPLLLDQRRIAGIGNIYSDEILFRAALRWDRRSDTLTDDEIRRLHASLVEVLEAAIVERGSTLADAQYVDFYGRPGGFAVHHQVHARAGEPCPRCGEPIVREKAAGRSTYRCARCQP